MSKGIYIGLGSVVFLAMIGAMALFNTWQIANLEDRLIKVDQNVAGLKSEIGALNNRVRQMGQGGGFVAGGSGSAGQGGTAAAGGCEGNLLGPPNSYTTEATQYGGRLTRAVVAGSKGYNILTENGADVSELFSYVGGVLADRNLQNPDEWAALLAQCVTANEEFTEYTVHLRRDVYWHPIQPKYLERSPWLEGQHPVTAHDFKFTMDMILNEQVEGAASLRSYYSQDFDRIEVIDDYTFKAIWKRRVFQSKTFTLGIYPMASWIYSRDPDGNEYPAEIMGKMFNQHWYVDMMGMGPYRFDSFRENEYVKLVKNNDYFGELPAFDEIIFQVVSNPDQQLRKLQDGELDFIELQPAQYKKQVVEAGASSQFTDKLTADGAPVDGKFGYAIYPRMAYRYIGWNADGAFFGDKRVRKAMTLALNRELLLRDIWMNLGQLTTGTFYPLSSEYDKSIPVLPYDLDEAARLLEEAGWRDTNGNGTRDKDGKEFVFTMLVYGYRPEFVSMAEFYKEDLKKIGVQLVISPVDWPTMQTKMNAKEFDAFTGGWALSWESDPYQIWHSSQADVPEGSNRIGFRNKRADEIIEEARVTFDLDKRLALFHEFHRILHEEQPATFFFADKGVGAWQSDMRNMVFQDIRPHDLGLPWFKDLQ